MPMESNTVYEQSAVVPYRNKGGELQILLITSRKGKKWIVPKGLVEEGLSPEESAAKEAFEEAGVEGIVSSELLGTYEYAKWGGTCHVQVFPMEVTQKHSAWEEDFRNRRWVSVDTAAKVVAPKKLRKIIRAIGQRQVSS